VWKSAALAPVNESRRGEKSICAVNFTTAEEAKKKANEEGNQFMVIAFKCTTLLHFGSVFNEKLALYETSHCITIINGARGLQPKG
jgi:hypothetical protein